MTRVTGPSATTLTKPDAIDALEERLRYHMGDRFDPDTDWRSFAERLIDDLQADGFDVVRPYLLAGNPR